MNKVINQLLSSFNIHPVLVDVGASGAPPDIWNKIARFAIYVGFDPDRREVHHEFEQRFHSAKILNEAITCDKQATEVLFYLTKSPYCSSTLEPNTQALSNYIFSDLFEIEKTVTAPAIRLDSVVERLSLPTIDWLKTDSQGTDLRIFTSLAEQIRQHVLAIDIEPGLIDVYFGEDLFVEAHKELTGAGYWLSTLKVQGTVRAKRSTLNENFISGSQLTADFIQKRVRTSPGWVEARYLRTIESLTRNHFSERDYILLWIFALLDKQPAFALDLAVEFKRLFGDNETSQTLYKETLLQLKRFHYLVELKSLTLRVARRLMKYLQ